MGLDRARGRGRGLEVAEPPISALSPANETVGRGYYAPTTLSTVDPDLAAPNILDGIVIFGFAGPPTVQDIADADALVGEVLAGATFYSVTGVRKTGNLPTVAIIPGSSAYPAGYHVGNVGGLPAIDGDLVTASIKNGITIFNVAGHVDVRNVSDATALVGEVKQGRTFYAVGGARKTGTLVTRTLNPANENVLAGYYGATTLSAVDVHLAAANIKLGVNIFGFVGTVAPGGVDTIEREHTGNIANGASYTPAVAGLFLAAYSFGLATCLTELFSTALGQWLSLPLIAGSTGASAVGDGTNLRFTNNTGGPRDIIVMRFHRSDKTYERHKDETLLPNASYTPAAEGYYSLGTDVTWIEAQNQGTAWEAFFESGTVGCLISDGVNYRAKSTGGVESNYVLIREV